jgi:ankyrin repeat protein
MDCSKSERDAVVKVLAQRLDVNINLLLTSGRSPLFWLSCYGYERVVAILMEAGVDLDLMDENGDMAVTMARKNGHGGIAKVLEKR